MEWPIHFQERKLELMLAELKQDKYSDVLFELLGFGFNQNCRAYDDTCFKCHTTRHEMDIDSEVK